MIEDFFIELDQQWKPVGRSPIRLPLIGSTALLLQCDYDRDTKDTDVLQVGQLTSVEIMDSLGEIAGPKSILAKRYRMYLDIVLSGVPFLPHPAKFHMLDDLNKNLKHFQVEVLDMIDVVVSKLKPFRPRDIDDIQYLADRGLIDPKKLGIRFQSAADYWSMDARVSQLKKFVQNLHTVQRDLLNVEETPIALPRWIDD